MTRARIIGLCTAHGHRRVDTSRQCCDGRCDKGRSCPLVVDRVSPPAAQAPMATPREETDSLRRAPRHYPRLTGGQRAGLWALICVVVVWALAIAAAVAFVVAEEAPRVANLLVGPR